MDRGFWTSPTFPVWFQAQQRSARASIQVSPVALWENTKPNPYLSVEQVIWTLEQQKAAYRHLSSTRSVPAGTGPQIKTTTGPGLLTDFSRRFLQTPLIGQNSSDIEL
ncbi:unnamed protein product [Gadus morhua 'NCC']